MTRFPRGARPQLSESWASMAGSHESVRSSISEEEFQPRLREAFYDDSNTPVSSRTLSNSDHMTRSRREDSAQSTFRSEHAETPRRRSSRQMSKDPEFAMPSPHGSEGSSSPTRQTPRQSSRMSTRSSGTIRRSAPMQRVDSANPQPNRRKNKSAKPSQREAEGDYLKLLWSHAVYPVLKYSFAVFGHAANFLKPIFGFGLVVLFLAFIFTVARSFVVNSVTTALSPICHIPGARFLPLPFCERVDHSAPKVSVEFDQLVNTQSAFEEVLQTSMGHANLPLAMKSSELSIRDLRTVVTYSNLASRHELLNEFNGFIDTARQASTGLTKFNSRIARSLDGILSTNRWTMHVLEGISAASDTDGVIPRFISKHLSIFSPHQRNPEDVVYDQYIRHTSEIEDQIAHCIVEANGLLDILGNLDDRLDVIADIAAREDGKVQQSKDELLADIWTMFGGNRNNLAKHERQLATLRDMNIYRKTAVQHVSATLLKLRAIEANLGHLKEQVAAPEVARSKNVPLAMHIDQVASAVERLENVRDEGRRIEAQRLKGIMGQVDDQWENSKIGIDRN